MFYGIEKKKLIAWKLGWIVIAYSFLSFIVSVIISCLKIPDGWIPIVIAVPIGVIVTIFMCVFWKQQKGYFNK